MSQSLDAKSRVWLELNIHFNIKSLISDPREQKWRLHHLDSARPKSWVQVVCHGLYETSRLFWTAATHQADKHVPSVPVFYSFAASSALLRVSHLLVSVPISKLHNAHFVTKPEASGLKLRFPLLELLTHFRCDLLLEFGVNLRHEKLVEMGAAHWAVHTLL